MSGATSTTSDPASATRAEVCATACADAWRGDGESIASPMGLVPSIGARLARLTFEPDLLLTDGEACLIGSVPPVGAGADGADGAVIEGWLPYRLVFDLLAHGKRHVMMGASQLDRYGNQNISCIGDWHRPSAALIGMRGAPGNTVNNPTSYWVPRHSTRVFVERADVVSGVGYDRALAGGESASRYHELRRVVTDLAVLDFATPDRSMRLRAVHPGVSVDEVVAGTGFPLVVEDTVEETRLPTPTELRLIREELDPSGLRDREVPH